MFHVNAHGFREMKCRGSRVLVVGDRGAFSPSIYPDETSSIHYKVGLIVFLLLLPPLSRWQTGLFFY